MAINFPNNPSVNQTYTLGIKTWIWNGYAWDLQVANTVGVTAFAQQAFNTANSASSNTIYTQGVDNTQNTWISSNATYTQSIVNAANTNASNASYLSYGTIPSSILGNSTHYIGTTAIALNRASASQTLTGVNIDGTSNIATYDSISTATTGTYYPQLSPSVSGNNLSYANTALSFNAGTGYLTTPNISTTSQIIEGQNSQLLLKPAGTYPTVIHRNDGSAYYLLLSGASASANGTWNSLRPFTVNTTSGSVTIDGTGVGTSFGGYVNRVTGNGNAAWLQQDGTGRSHWYWNTYGGTTPTFTNANEDASSISLHVNNATGGGTFFHRSANGVGQLAGNTITWTTTLYTDLNGISWKGYPILHSQNYNSYAPSLTGTGASGTWNINISGTSGADATQNTRLSNVEANTVYLLGALNQTNTNIVNANTQLKAYSDGTFYTKTGGTISGPVSINSNLLVTGNLTVSGNVSIVYANNLAIQDNMIYLNQGDSGNVNPDLGFTGAYNDGIYHHAGFFRDHATGVWKVFDNYLPEPDASAWIDQSNSSFRIADFQANNVTFGKITTSSTQLVSNLNADYLDGQHGSYYAVASEQNGINATQNTNITNTQTWLSANVAYLSGVDIAQNASIVSANTQLKAYVDGQITNTLNYSNGVDAAQNTRLTGAENTTVYLQGALNQANTNIVNANTQLKSYTDGAIASANTQLKGYVDGLISYNAGVNTTQNTNITGATTLAQAAYNQANTDYTTVVATAGSYGTSTATPTITVAANGRITSATSTSISFPVTSVGGAGVTGAVSNTQLLASIISVDGTGSNLDADLLDGQHGSYYAPNSSLGNYLPLAGGTLTGRVQQSLYGFQSNLVGTDPIIYRRANSGFFQTATASTANGWPQNGTYYHLLSSTHFNDTNYFAMQFAANFYDSANIYYRSTNNDGNTAWNKIWHSGNDGLGSGLDADLLDGQSGTYYSPLTFTQAAYNQANTDYTTVVATAGSYGSSTTTPTITLAANGRITSATSTSIAFPVTSVGGAGVTGAVSNTQLSTSVTSGLGYTPVQAGTSTIGQAPTFANMQGGRTYTTYDMTTSFANLYETRFVNLGASTNVPAGMSGMGYWFGMGAGDTGARGFDLIGTSGSGLWYRERSSNTWNNVLTTTGTGTNLTALNASNLTSGTVPTARLGTGTANASTYLAGDSTWKTISVSASSLTGTTLASGVTTSSLTSVGTLTSLTVSGVSSLYSISVPNATGNPGLQIVTNQGTAWNSAIINNWGNSSNPGVMVGTTRSDGTAFQVSASVPLTGGLPSGTGTSLFSVTGSGSVIHGTAANNITITPTSISYNSSVPTAFAISKNNYASRIDFGGIGGLNSSSPGPFWQGLHFATPDTITVNGANQFPRVSAYWSYTSTSNPTDLTFNLYAGNYASANVMNMVIGTGSAGSVSFDTNGTKRTYIDASGNLYPAVNNSYDLGKSTNYWSNVYATNHYGSGANLTNLTAGNLSGTIPDSVITNSKLVNYRNATAQFTLNGGGTVTWTGSSLLWSSRVIAIPVENTEYAASGYIDINCPTSGTVTYYNAAGATTTVTCTAAGIPLGGWEALYYQVTMGQSSASDQTKFRVVNYQNTTWSPGEGWLLIASVNGDGTNIGHVKWLPGQVNLPSTGSTVTYNVGTGVSSWGANASNLSSGTVPTARLATGTASSTTYLRGDQTWATISPGATITNDTTTNATRYLIFDDATSGSLTSVGVSDTKLYFNPSTGTLYSTIFSSLSDQQLKSNVVTINSGLDVILKINPVSYEWTLSGKKSHGVIAQEIESIIPEIVSEEGGVKSVEYQGIIPFLISAIQEQQKQIDELKSIINSNK